MSFFCLFLVGLPLFVTLATAIVIMLLLAYFLYNKNKRKLSKGKDWDSESESTSHNGTVSSRVEKISKHSARKKRGRSDLIEDTSEGIPQAKSESDKSSMRSPKKKKRKSMERFGHNSNQVSPASDLESSRRGSAKPGAVGDRRQGNKKQSRSHSTGNALIIGEMLPKPRRKSEGNALIIGEMLQKPRRKSEGNALTIGEMLQKPRRKSDGSAIVKDKGTRHNQNKNQMASLTTNVHKELVESRRKNSKGLKKGSGMMALHDINGSTTGSARTNPKRRKTLEQFTTESVETTGVTATNGYHNETSDSTTTYLKQKKKSLTLVADVSVNTHSAGY